MIVMDSCKLRIPLEACTILNDSLHSYWIPMEMNKETGELRDINSDYKAKAYRHNFGGISTRVAIERQVTGEGILSDYVTVGINAKQLQERYFEGITPENIVHVHRYIMDLKLFECSLQDFQSGQVTDCDYRKDFTCDDMDSLIDKLQGLTIPKAKKGHGYKRHSKETNKGIEWSDRRTTSISQNPFVKVYSKELDMKHNSTEFSAKYLGSVDCTNRARVEFTIKNRKHFRRYGVTNTSLLEATEISQDLLQTMLTESINKHIQKPVRAPKEPEGISTSEQETINLISLLIQYKVGLNEARSALFGNLPRNTRNRRGENFDEVWKKHFSKLPQVKHLDRVENWLSEVGVQFL